MSEQEWLAGCILMALLYGEYLHYAIYHPGTPYISPHDWVAGFLGPY